MKIIIVGAGRVGSHLGKILANENHDVTIIEPDDNARRRAMEMLDVMVIDGNGASPKVLMQAGISDCDMLIAVSAIDEINILACMIAARVGVPKKIARLRNAEFSDPNSLLTKQDLGIDFIIHPEVETARELVLLIRRSSATDVVEFADGKVQLVGIRIDKTAPIVNKTLQQIDKENPDVLFRVVAIFRGNRTIVPTGDCIVNKGDQLFFITKTELVQNILQLAGKSEEKMEKLMILGGGKVGRLVATELEKDKALNVKLIESSKEKTMKIANQLRRTLIIVGDGTDLDLLATEGIMDMDGYIAVTSDEETNIISSLMAKHLGVRRSLTLVNRSDYLPVMSSIGLDAAVDQQMITANTILRFIRRGNIVSYATLRGIEAEVLEVEVGEKAKIANMLLKKVKFPANAIIGLVTRNDKVFVPTGETNITPGDKLIVFTLPDAISAIERMI